jgi:murein DD-endopeptidase MepM/ murein hydrolase activator NlpD
MSNQNFFYYNEEECRFEKAEYRPLDRAIHYFSMWILSGVVLAGTSIAGLSSFVGSPSELALVAENTELLRQVRQANEKLEQMDNELTTLSKWDDDLYRSMLGLDPITEDERSAGVGGADVFARFNIFGTSTASALRSVNQNLERMEHRISIQKRSFEEIRTAYAKNEERLENLPVMKPIDATVISGFGMRRHPIFKMYRLHEGIDFKASVGEPVYATGNGVIGFSGWQGGYGKLIVINHGDNIQSAYAHLSRFADGIRNGMRVNRGDLIGYSGNTGLSSGPHLHYEIRIDGSAVNPMDYLALDIGPDEYRAFLKAANENPKSMD